MRFSLYSLAALPLAAQALEFIDDNSFVEQAGLVRFPLSANRHTPNKNHKRQKQTDVTNRKTGYFYTIDIDIGSPPQKVAVNFDTGSAELWVNPNCANSGDVDYCKSFGAFGKSSSFVDLNTNSTLSYGAGSAQVGYGYDYVTVGSSKINQQIFGVAYDSEFHSVGILGAGPDLSGWDSKYPYVLDNLYKQKFINSRAFSLDIRSIENDRGAVVFGGIDVKKFSGPLEKRPIVPAAQSPDGNTRYWINLDGLTVTKEDGTSQVDVFDQPGGQVVLLDSGYTISTLPGTHFNKILEAFPSAEKSSNSNQYTVDCKVADTKGTVNFKFGKTIIKVPYADFIWQQPDYNACVLGVMQDDKFPVLGDTFLRAAYAVYDWDNREIYLANNEDCGSELVAIGSGPGAVPAVEGKCGKPEPTSSASSSSVAPTTAPSSASVSTPAVSTPLPSSPVVNGTSTVSHPAGNSTSSRTTAPVTTASITSSAAWNQTTSSKTTITSAVTTTTVHTITSCAPTVTNCPVGQVTTEVLTSYTTYCPGDETETPAPVPTTSKYVKPPCPEVTMTIVIPQVIYCTAGMPGCKEGETITTSQPAVVTPITPVDKPTPIPGCVDCHPKATSAHTTAEIVKPTSKPAATGPAVPTAPVVPVVPTAPVGITTMATQKPSGTAPGATSPVESQPPTVTGAAAGLVVPGFAAVAAVVALL